MSLRLRWAADAKAIRSWPSRLLRLFVPNWWAREALGMIGLKRLVIKVLLFINQKDKSKRRR
jgi:hypothetical protein